MQHPSKTTAPLEDLDTFTNATPGVGGHHHHVGDGSLSMSRRAVLGGLPLAGAVLALPLQYRGDTPLPASDEDGEPPHPVLLLPFVRGTTEAERAAGAASRCFWSVSPCGFYRTDCATGARYAEEALAYMHRHQAPYIFPWIVLDMTRQGPASSGIEVGFLAHFARLALAAHAADLAKHAGDLA